MHYAQILRLSYEEPTLSQSTPNLYESSDEQESPEPQEQQQLEPQSRSPPASRHLTPKHEEEIIASNESLPDLSPVRERCNLKTYYSPSNKTLYSLERARETVNSPPTTSVPSSTAPSNSVPEEPIAVKATIPPYRPKLREVCYAIGK